MSLDIKRGWQAITFRNDPQEFAFTHAVYVRKLDIEGMDRYEVSEAACGIELPVNMQDDIAAFQSFINTNWLSCPRCQLIAHSVGAK